MKFFITSFCSLQGLKSSLSNGAPPLLYFLTKKTNQFFETNLSFWLMPNNRESSYGSLRLAFGGGNNRAGRENQREGDKNPSGGSRLYPYPVESCQNPSPKSTKARARRVSRFWLSLLTGRRRQRLSQPNPPGSCGSKSLPLFSSR